MQPIHCMLTSFPFCSQTDDFALPLHLTVRKNHWLSSMIPLNFCKNIISLVFRWDCLFSFGLLVLVFFVCLFVFHCRMFNLYILQINGVYRRTNTPQAWTSVFLFPHFYILNSCYTCSCCETVFSRLIFFTSLGVFPITKLRQYTVTNQTSMTSSMTKYCLLFLLPNRIWECGMLGLSETSTLKTAQHLL